jgi:hypothetical protein
MGGVNVGVHTWRGGCIGGGQARDGRIGSIRCPHPPPIISGVRGAGYQPRTCPLVVGATVRPVPQRSAVLRQLAEEDLVAHLTDHQQVPIGGKRHVSTHPARTLGELERRVEGPRSRDADVTFDSGRRTGDEQRTVVQLEHLRGPVPTSPVVGEFPEEASGE